MAQGKGCPIAFLNYLGTKKLDWRRDLLMIFIVYQLKKKMVKKGPNSVSNYLGTEKLS